MAVTSAEEFFAVLEKSKLLIPSQLAQARRAAQQSNDPTIVARGLARLGLITRWQAGQLLAGRSSFYLGKYRLVELLGRGGTGNVFLGQHVTMNRRAALKVIARQVSQDPVLLKRFLATARAIATLDHPNIVQTYSVDNEGERYYLVTEYVEGVDLQRLVNQDGPLAYDLAADYIRQAADGLEHAHGQDMIHANIKPSRLLVSLQGMVKILDFGLAWLDDHGQRPTGEQHDRPSGSVDYLAPEQIDQKPHADERSDIYALGCILYFLLIGRPPSLHHRTQEPPDAHVIQSGIPAELAAIGKRMMATRPEDRCQTATEVSRALAAWQSSSLPPNRDVPLPRAKRLDEP